MTIVAVAVAAPAVVVHARPMAWDGPLVAFESYRDGKADIYTAPVDGSAPAVNLTSTPDATDRHPSWNRAIDGNTCPEGEMEPPTTQLLAFDSDRDGGDTDIFVMNALAPSPTSVTNLTPDDQGDDSSPAWSPAGRIAYTVDNGGNRDVWVMDSDGSNKTPITDNAGDDANPDWAPFSDLQLAFESDRSGTRQIYVVDLAPPVGSGPVTPGAVHQVTTGSAQKHDPTWANYSDNQLVSLQGPHDIAYSVEQDGSRYLDVAEVGSNDGPPVTDPFHIPEDIRTYPLTGDPGGDSAPNWSPIGLSLVYASTAGGTNEDIYGLGRQFAPMSPTPWQGPATRLTTDVGRDTNPDWEPYQQCSVMSPRPPLPAPTRKSKPRPKPKPKPKPTTPPPATNAGRRAPRLAIRGVRWHAGRVRVTGRAARGLPGSVRVAFACGRRPAQHTQRRTRARAGRFGARLRAPRACRRARRGVVAAAYGGGRRYRAQKVSRRVHRL